jgi:ATP-dependent Clp protease ATP-binding subunit ClpA
LGHRETHPLLSQETLNQFQTVDVKLSFVLFDEIEKASDALWNLLLGILDKATLTLGDNRKVDFSRALIFLTSNLGASEMNAIVRPSLGFTVGEAEQRAAQMLDGSTAGKLTRAGVEAARRRFSPEFINRLDKVVVFNPLGESELRRILGLELQLVQERVSRAIGTRLITFSVNDAAGSLLLEQGTDLRYGARHLKRAIERLLVQPISNLIASGQVQTGDSLLVDCDRQLRSLVFLKESKTSQAGSPAGKSAAA